MLWVADDADAWVPAQIVSEQPDGGAIVRKKGVELRLTPAERAAADPVDESSLNLLIDNLVELESFCEGIILHQCGRRFERGQVGRWLGAIGLSDDGSGDDGDGGGGGG